MKQFRKQYIINALSQALRQGTSPHKLALTCAFGAVFGIFPIWGTTTWICFAVAITLRLNMVIIQLVNYLFFPFQLLLIIPFIKAGTFIFNLEPFPYAQRELIELFRNDFWAVLKDVGLSLGGGVIAWMLVVVPLFLTVYYLTLGLFRRMKPFNEN